MYKGSDSTPVLVIYCFSLTILVVVILVAHYGFDFHLRLVVVSMYFLMSIGCLYAFPEERDVCVSF